MNAAPPIPPPTLAAWLHAITFCLARSRFSLIVLTIGFVLLLTDQGHDALTAYAEDHMTVRLAFAVAFWAFSIWGWSRLLLDVQYDEQPKCISCYNVCRKWMPGILGAIAFLVVAFSALQIQDHVLMWWSLAEFVVFVIVVITIQPATNRLAASLNKSTHASIRKMATSLQLPDADLNNTPPYSNLWEMLGIPNRNNLLSGKDWAPRALLTLSMFIAFLILAILGNFNPILLGKSGALIVLFAWGATWLPIGSVMSYIADKKGIPLLTLLAIIAFACGFTNDNHKIRNAHKDDERWEDKRPSITEALEAWGKANKNEGGKPTPFVIVATAGGGIRAAYWTATVLGDMQDNAANFSERTFALSGVSGGSVGATIYRALLTLSPGQFKKSCPKGMRDCAQRILGKNGSVPENNINALGSLTAALLYPDLAQRFWPWLWFPDRAAALEQSWEESFKIVTGDDRLNSSLGSLGKDAPSLFLNSTWVENGRRIIASNLRFAKEDADEKDAFKRANDELNTLNYDLRLSTAAHNSARFPFVSPPGMWRNKNGDIAGRLQDGGLFENYGAETAMEILNLACIKFACPDASDARKSNLKNIVPVVILITSDPALPENLADSPKGNKPVTFGYELRTTFMTYESVRSGRATEAASQLEDMAKIHKLQSDNFFQFRMCPTDSVNGQPPLGWALSEHAQKTIEGYLPKLEDASCAGKNAAHSQALRKLLGDV